MTDVYWLRCLLMKGLKWVENIIQHAMNDIFKIPELSIQQIWDNIERCSVFFLGLWFTTLSQREEGCCAKEVGPNKDPKPPNHSHRPTSGPSDLKQFDQKIWDARGTLTSFSHPELERPRKTRPVHFILLQRARTPTREDPSNHWLAGCNEHTIRSR